MIRILVEHARNRSWNQTINNSLMNLILKNSRNEFGTTYRVTIGLSGFGWEIGNLCECEWRQDFHDEYWIAAVCESMAALERRNYGMVPAGESSIENMLKELKSRSWKSEMRHMFGGLYKTSMPCNHHSFLVNVLWDG